MDFNTISLLSLSTRSGPKFLAGLGFSVWPLLLYVLDLVGAPLASVEELPEEAAEAEAPGHRVQHRPLSHGPLDEAAVQARHERGVRDERQRIEREARRLDGDEGLPRSADERLFGGGAVARAAPRLGRAPRRGSPGCAGSSGSWRASAHGRAAARGSRS